MSRVLLSNVSKSYGDVAALHSLNMEIHEGEFLTLLGPSGCGKTTTLRLIAGFIQPTAGTIFLGDDDITTVAPQHREIGMVFQDYALFPHMTISENIAFGLRERRYEKGLIPTRVKELLELIHLPDVGDRYPSEVSGGQQQRIAVARAVAYPPRVLLMDEPLGALDLKLREAMQTELRRIQRELRITTVYVTHDQTEAMNMSDRIAVMNQGLIEQLGSAEQIYNHPATRFVADFVGQINLLPARVIANDKATLVVEAAGATLNAATDLALASEQSISIGVRPELLTISPRPCEGMNTLSGHIERRNFAGNLLHVHITLDDGTPVVVEGRPQDEIGENGSAVHLCWRAQDTVVLTK